MVFRGWTGREAHTRTWGESDAGLAGAAGRTGGMRAGRGEGGGTRTEGRGSRPAPIRAGSVVRVPPGERFAASAGGAGVSSRGASRRSRGWEPARPEGGWHSGRAGGHGWCTTVSLTKPSCVICVMLYMLHVWCKGGASLARWRPAGGAGRPRRKRETRPGELAHGAAVGDDDQLGAEPRIAGKRRARGHLVHEPAPHAEGWQAVAPAGVARGGVPVPVVAHACRRFRRGSVRRVDDLAVSIPRTCRYRNSVNVVLAIPNPSADWVTHSLGFLYQRYRRRKGA